MKVHPLVLASGAILVSSMAWGQQQYDSLGSPTPAPNQQASPNAPAPNVPIPAGKAENSVGTPGTMGTNGSAVTTGSGSATLSSADGGVNGPINAGSSTPTDSGTTPGGLTPD